MKFTQIRAFHHVAESGGFSLAAARLGLTQPAVSDAVAKLEAAYDILLFERAGKRVRLTRRGEELLQLTRPLFEAESELRGYLDETRSRLGGTLRLIADSAHHVTGVLAAFRAAHPGIRISLRAGNSAEVKQALAAYEADIGVLGDTGDGERLARVPLGASPIIAFAARDFAPLPAAPCRLADLVALPLVLRETGSRTRYMLEEAASREGLSLRPAIEAEGREAVREIVASGAGIGFVSEAEFGLDPRLVKLPLADRALVMAETVVCMPQRREVRRIRAFMALAERLGQG